MGRNNFQEQIDITHFLRKFRRMQETLTLKMPLSRVEKIYVESNSRKKLYLSDHESSEEDQEKVEVHEREATHLFKSKKRWHPNLKLTNTSH